MELLFIWLLFGIFSAILASNKGRSGCGWFVVGILFGPFGLLVGLMSPVEKGATDPDPVADEADDDGNGEEGFPCPRCQRTIYQDVETCPWCGAEIEQS